nr:MAG TPA: hypothetical protein [Caudoviricetes sp.]
MNIKTTEACKEILEKIKSTINTVSYKSITESGLVEYAISIVKEIEQKEYGESLSFYKILSKKEKIYKDERKNKVTIEVESVLGTFTYVIIVTGDLNIAIYKKFKDPIRTNMIEIKIV